MLSARNLCVSCLGKMRQGLYMATKLNLYRIANLCELTPSFGSDALRGQRTVIRGHA